MNFCNGMFHYFLLAFFHVFRSIKLWNKTCSSPTSVVIFQPNAPAYEATFVIWTIRSDALSKTVPRDLSGKIQKLASRITSERVGEEREFLQTRHPFCFEN